MPMTDAQQRAVLTALRVRGVHGKCRACGDQNAALAGNLVGLQVLGTTSVTPAAVMFCRRCGCQSLFGLASLGKGVVEAFSNAPEPVNGASDEPPLPDLLGARKPADA